MKHRSVIVRSSFVLAILSSLAGCSLAAPEEETVSSSAAQTNSHPPIRFQIGAFIPCPGLDFLGKVYHGDDRLTQDRSGRYVSAFGFDPNRSRVAVDAVFDLNGNDSVERYIGRSYRWDNDSSFYSKVNGWCTIFNGDARPNLESEATASADGITFDVQHRNEPAPQGADPGAVKWSRFGIRAAATNPVSTLPAPAISIDCDIVLYGDDTDRIYDVDYVCDRTQFPSIEMYIDGRPVFLSDAMDHSPTDLFSHKQERGNCTRPGEGTDWTCRPRN